ncbi:MAG: hypothetical protein LBS99_05900 [Clostridiales bacterium]|jgi:uncharacterized membrane protein YccC|nr:hypothetical protein [Clostridiales bacterium]
MKKGLIFAAISVVVFFLVNLAIGSIFQELEDIVVAIISAVISGAVLFFIIFLWSKKHDNSK